MRPGKALHFLNQDPIWLIRAFGILTALIIPPYRLLFPDDAFDPMWIRWTISGGVAALVVLSFLWKGLRYYSNTIIYFVTTIMSGWMLGLALMNDLSADYTSSYFILVFTSMILYRSWAWLTTFMLLNLSFAAFFILQMDTTLVNPWTFFSMQLSIFAITVLGLMKGFSEFANISSREELLRSISSATFEYSKTGILVTDVKGAVLHSNRLWLEMWQLFDSEHEIDDGAWMLVCQRFLKNPEIMLEVARKVGPKKDDHFIEILRLTDGRVIELNSQPFEISGNLHGRIWMFDDKTVSYLTEERLKISGQKLIKQNAALVKLASSQLAHLQNAAERFETITRTVSETLGVNRTSIWRYNPVSETLECQSSCRSDEHTLKNGYEYSRANNPDLFLQLETERVIQRDNFESQTLRKQSSIASNSISNGESKVIIPLRSNGALYGMLISERTGQYAFWSTDEHQFLASVGDLTMVAIEADERRKIEASSLEMTTLLETVFELAGVGILVTDSNRKVINVNQQYLSIWDVKEEFVLNEEPEAVIEYCRSQLLDTGDLPESMRFLLENPDENDSKTLFFKDGKIVERFTEVLRSGNEITGRVWFFRDVTTRQQAESKLIESEIRNKAILDAMPDLILRIRANGEILDAKVPEDSPMAGKFDPEKAQNVHAIFPEVFAEKLLDRAKEALLKGILIEEELEANLLKSVGDCEIRVIQSGLDEVLVMIRDVTERKKTERELVQRNHELDSFVYRASHDLKAPLNSLMGLLDIVKSESLDDSLLRYVKLMDKSVVKLDTFIRNLADFSRIARLEIQAKPVDFELLLEEVTESLFFMENAANIEKIIEIEPGPEFVGDSFHIGIVLSNLISNAFKYTDPQKQHPRVKIRIEPNAESCKISIEDNGLGIPKEYQGRIFDLFFRASTQSFGSGLGLYITRNAIEKMHGQIEIVSEPGEGTTFKVTLPNIANKQIVADLAMAIKHD